jgi:hypothetical protein
MFLFCGHKDYKVLGWKYVNLRKPTEYIEARVQCQKCGKIVFKKIEGEKINAFVTIYEDKFGM